MDVNQGHLAPFCCPIFGSGARAPLRSICRQISGTPKKSCHTPFLMEILQVANFLFHFHNIIVEYSERSQFHAATPFAEKVVGQNRPILVIFRHFDLK